MRLLPTSQPLLDVCRDAFCYINPGGLATFQSENMFIEYVLVQEKAFAPLALENSMMPIQMRSAID